MLGSNLRPDIRAELEQFLHEHRDVFAWSHEDMSGINPTVMCHQLCVNPKHKPVVQKRRAFNSERYEAINVEVKKMLAAGLIREVSYLEWLANVVLVKKANIKWRVCINYIDLDKICPKDCFPLSRIDQLVDATAGYELLSFMDAYSGYNQIPLSRVDQAKTTFTMDQGLYCYQVMSFDLKNAGATYQRLINKIFAPFIRRSMEVYIDDMLVKSQCVNDHVKNLRDCFDTL